MKKIKYFLQQYESIWALPLAFCIFWLFGQIITMMFGYTVGVYDMSFMQPLFLAIAIVIGSSGASVMGMYFTFRGIYKFIYGKKNKQGEVKNYSKDKWRELTAFQQLSMAFTVYFLFFFAVVIVYLKLV